MKKSLQFLLPVAALSGLSVNAYAADSHPSTVREDRVWVCSHIDWYPHTFLHLRFDGTVDRNGVTYHRLVNFKKIHVSRSYDEDDKMILEVQQVEDNLDIPMALMREEDGVVYMLVDDDCEWSWADSYMVGMGIVEGTERVVYNFNLSRGDIYDTQSDGLMELGKSVVTSTGTKAIMNEECRTYKSAFLYDWDFDAETIEIEEWDDCGYEMIEGIGCTSYGCLGYIQWELPTCPCYSYFFEGVYDLEGNVVYGDPRLDLDDPNVGVAYLSDEDNRIDSMFAETGHCDVHSLDGTLLRRSSTRADLDALSPGVYILRTADKTLKVTLSK